MYIRSTTVSVVKIVGYDGRLLNKIAFTEMDWPGIALYVYFIFARVFSSFNTD